MLWNHKGFFMTDLVITMSAIIVIGSTILPMTIQLMVKTSEEKEMYKARVFLYEELHELLALRQSPKYERIVKQNTTYEFIPNPDLKEVCIQFDVRHQNTKRVCEDWE